MKELPLYSEADDDARLDLLSISQKASLRCSFGAPYFAYEKQPKTWVVLQGCCNHWECVRCGQQRARQEYGRIVNGCREIETKHELYFITITCRGREMSIAEAIESYLKWTNRLLSSLRADGHKRGISWQYVQVTEWQKRGHPHSHILTTYHPADLTTGLKTTTVQLADGGMVTGCLDALRSEYLQHRVLSAGFGAEYDISHVLTVEGASRYVAKYLFKPTMFSRSYPKHWRRVRYSQSFPRLAIRKTDAVCLLSSQDWQLLARKAIVVSCEGEQTREDAEYFLRGSDCIIETKKDLTVK